MLFWPPRWPAFVATAACVPLRLQLLDGMVAIEGGKIDPDALGQSQDFGGILPKQRRMAALTLALLVVAVEDIVWGPG